MFIRNISIKQAVQIETLKLPHGEWNIFIGFT